MLDLFSTLSITVSEKYLMLNQHRQCDNACMTAFNWLPMGALIDIGKRIFVGKLQSLWKFLAIVIVNTFV